jgi:hypothetical protein
VMIRKSGCHFGTPGCPSRFGTNGLQRGRVNVNFPHFFEPASSRIINEVPHAQTLRRHRPCANRLMGAPAFPRANEMRVCQNGCIAMTVIARIRPWLEVRPSAG